MRSRFTAMCVLGLALAGCNTVTVNEGVLSTNQRVALVSSPGDGVTPPTAVVFFEDRRGQFTPVASGFAQAPVTAVVSGLGAGIAVGTGNFAAASAIRPSRTNVIQTGAAARSISGGAISTATGGAGGAGGASGAGGAVNVRATVTANGG